MTGLILGIYNSDGVIVARYVYDAFGNHKVYDGYYNANTNDSFIRTIKPFRYKRYFYDEDVNLYYLKSRFYNPLCGRFLTDDDEAYIDESSFIGFNLFTYCGNDPVNKYDPNGNFSLPNWAKWVIGGVAFTGAIALTYLTGGALATVFIGMIGSILLDGVVEGAISYANKGNFWKGFGNGAANGAMWGGIFALGGAVLRTIKMFKNGIAIGENMKRVNNLAKAGHQITYNGMPGFKFVKMFGGDDLARTLSMKHNQAFIERMMKWGVKIVDFGIYTSRNYRSFYYLMETIVSNGYVLLQLMY